MDRMIAITERVRAFLEEIPAGITVVAAAKTRSAEEIRAAIDGGIRVFGANYVQEAQSQITTLQALATSGYDQAASENPLPARERISPPIDDSFSYQPEGLAQATWDMIGHLQRNKARVAVGLFDQIQTLDSLRLARALETACQALGRTLPMLIEVNSAREDQKHGILPEDVPTFVQRFGEAGFSHVRIEGLMTMGPWSSNPEDLRPFFVETRALYERIGSQEIPGVEMTTLSMGMSGSYRVALEEGATLIRVGTRLFGPRASKMTGPKEENA